MSIISSLRKFFFGAGALGQGVGPAFNVPSVPLDSTAQSLGIDAAMQIATVWACVERRATTVASLPLFVYRQDAGGQKVLARDSSLYELLHDRPNSRMTPSDFWRTMMPNYDLRGNAYARITRREDGEAIALHPMAADQVTPVLMPDGSVTYEYRIDAETFRLKQQDVLHIKGLGNGTIGLDKLSFMRSTVDEVAKAQGSAAKIFGSSGKPTGVLMIDSVLKPDQHAALLSRFGEMAAGNIARLFILEANMKYQQLSLTPEQVQLLETRNFGVEELSRWFDCPPVLIHHANVTTWGSGIEQIVDGFHKLTIRPILVAIEQAIRHTVLTARQRQQGYLAEFSLDALLRGNAQDRSQLYSQGAQNGWMTRNEIRQFENLPPVAGGDDLTVQVNLARLQDLGGVQNVPA